MHLTQRPRLLTIWQKPHLSPHLSLLFPSYLGHFHLPSLPKSQGEGQLASTGSEWPDPNSSIETSAQYHTCGVFWFSLQMKIDASVLTSAEEPLLSQHPGELQVHVSCGFQYEQFSGVAKTSSECGSAQAPCSYGCSNCRGGYLCLSTWLLE